MSLSELRLPGAAALPVNSLYLYGINGQVIPAGSLVALSSNGTVTQTGAITSTVTYNGSSCRITTASFTLPSGIIATFPFNNSSITTNSIIQISITGNSGGNGCPILYMTEQNNGSVRVNLFNASDTQGIVGSVIVSVLVI